MHINEPLARECTHKHCRCMQICTEEKIPPAKRSSCRLKLSHDLFFIPPLP